MGGVHKDWVPFKGVDNGLAPLDEDGFVPSEHIPGSEGGHVIKGVVLFGNLLNYNRAEGAPIRRVQNLLFELADGRVYDRMVAFVASGGNAARNIQMGVYDQANPAVAGEPRNLIAQTDLTPTDGMSGSWVALPLTDGAGTPQDLLIAVKGFYWEATITDSTSLKLSATPEDYPAGFLPRREFTAPTSSLPAVALAGTNPLASCQICALVEKGIVLPF